MFILINYQFGPNNLRSVLHTMIYHLTNIPLFIFSSSEFFLWSQLPSHGPEREREYSLIYTHNSLQIDATRPRDCINNTCCTYKPLTLEHWSTYALKRLTIHTVLYCTLHRHSALVIERGNMYSLVSQGTWVNILASSQNNILAVPLLWEEPVHKTHPNLCWPHVRTCEHSERHIHT